MEESLEDRAEEIVNEMDKREKELKIQMVREIIFAAKKEMGAIQEENKALKEKLGLTESKPIIGGGSDFKLPPTQG